jgi:ribosomal protein S18 acetylase RimI-like enzyme
MIRSAEAGDAAVIGQLLHDFNSEYHEFTPGPRPLAERVARLLPAGEMTVLLAGDPPRGLAVLRLRPAIFTDSLDCYLEELYVAPASRGQGLGRALMQAAIEHACAAGAGRMELGTSEDDAAARALYESLGFSNREGKADGPIMFFYEREL